MASAKVTSYHLIKWDILGPSRSQPQNHVRIIMLIPALHHKLAEDDGLIFTNMLHLGPMISNIASSSETTFIINEKLFAVLDLVCNCSDLIVDHVLWALG